MINRWHDSHVVCIASGPSLRSVDCERVKSWRESGKDRRVIVVNTSFKLAPWADVLYACDLPWWDVYYAEAKATGAELWTSSKKPRDKYGLSYIERNEEKDPERPRLTGLSELPGKINHGGNSGHQAVELAYVFGAKRIVLLGYDMQTTHQRTHWHGNHPPGLQDGVLRYHQSWASRMEALIKDLIAAGVEIWNCTRYTALRSAPKKALEFALA